MGTEKGCVFVGFPEADPERIKGVFPGSLSWEWRRRTGKERKAARVQHQPWADSAGSSMSTLRLGNRLPYTAPRSPSPRATPDASRSRAHPGKAVAIAEEDLEVCRSWGGHTEPRGILEGIWVACGQ